MRTTHLHFRKLSCFLVLALVFAFKGASFSATLSNGYLSLYGTFVDYEGSDKDFGYATAVYGSFGNGREGLEAAVSYFYLDYRSNQASLKQRDFTLVYTKLFGLSPGLSLRLGGHYILTDDELTHEGKVLFGGLTYLVPYRWNVGLQASYSDYRHDVSVIQLSPHFGRFLGVLSGSSSYLEARAYLIGLRGADELGLSRDLYGSLEISLTNTFGALSVKVSAWLGKEVFAVKSGGFVVYNLLNEYRGGVSAEVSYFYEGHLFGISFVKSVYEETDSFELATQTGVTVFFGLSF